MFSVSQGYSANILKVKRYGILSRHRHVGRVHATTLRGRWHYLEHDWWAEEGSYSFEYPRDIHTLEVPEGVAKMCMLFYVPGAYVYVDPNGKVLVLRILLVSWVWPGGIMLRMAWTHNLWISY